MDELLITVVGNVTQADSQITYALEKSAMAYPHSDKTFYELIMSRKPIPRLRSYVLEKTAMAYPHSDRRLRGLRVYVCPR